MRLARNVIYIFSFVPIGSGEIAEGQKSDSRTTTRCEVKKDVDLSEKRTPMSLN